MYLRIESFVPFETILNNSIEHFAFSILTEAGIYFLFVVVATTADFFQAILRHYSQRDSQREMT